MSFSKKIRLGQLTSAALLISAAGQGVNFVFHVMLGNQLQPQGYGVFSVYWVAISILAMWASMGIPQVILKFAPQYLEDQNTAKLWGLVYRLGLPFCLILSGISGALYCSLWAVELIFKTRLLSYNSPILLGVFVPVLSLIGAFGRALGGASFYIAIERLVPYCVACAIGAGFVVFDIALTPLIGINALLCGYVISALIGGAGLWRRLWQVDFKDGVQSDWLMWGKFASATIVISFVFILINRLDIFFLKSISGAQAAGLYGAAMRFADIGVFTLTALMPLYIPLISQGFAQGNLSQVMRVYRWACLLSTLTTFGLLCVYLVFGKALLGIFGPDFEYAFPLLWILLCGQLVSSFFGPIGNVLVMGNYHWHVSVILLIFLPIKITIAVVLIQSFGEKGAALSQAIGLGLLNLTYGVLLYTKLKISFIDVWRGKYG